MAITDDYYQAIRVKSIHGRYITNKELENFLQQSSDKLIRHTAGVSVNKRPIHLITIGKGSIKVLLWSQMHGNESTTTKAVIDLLGFFGTGGPLAQNILSKCTIALIPILNPDGAAVYTRVNANKVDLNRDAQDKSQPESICLRGIFDNFQPDFCFNLHDQRTIFNVGNTAKPATISFLAPAADKERSATISRISSMRLIVLMNESLQAIIPGNVGRYDDTFNANCVGDAFQILGTPTVLIEAGHSPGDYVREQSRRYVFFAILEGLKGIAEEHLGKLSEIEYHNIPENDNRFFDVLLHNVNLLNSRYKKGESVGVLYKEVLKDNEIQFVPYIEAIGKLTDKFGHEVIDCAIASDHNRLKTHMEINKLILF